MEFLGWYTTGEAPSERDTHFHQQVGIRLSSLSYILYPFPAVSHPLPPSPLQVCTDNETALLLKLNPLALTNQVPPTLTTLPLVQPPSPQLPVSLFESLIEIVDGEVNNLPLYKLYDTLSLHLTITTPTLLLHLYTLQ